MAVSLASQPLLQVPGEIAPRAAARVGKVSIEQRLQRFIMRRATVALEDRVCLPLESVVFEHSKYFIRGARLLAGWVDILYPQQPLAMHGPGLQVTGGRGHQGTKVQGAGG